METKCITHTQHQYTLRYKHIQACIILYPLQSFYCVDRRKTTWWGRVPSMHRGRKVVSQRDLVEESVSKGSWENMEGEMETERSHLKPLTCAAFRAHICVCVASRGSWVCNATEPPSFSSPAFSSSLPSFPSLLPPPLLTSFSQPHSHKPRNARHCCLLAPGECCFPLTLPEAGEVEGLPLGLLEP